MRRSQTRPRQTHDAHALFRITILWWRSIRRRGSTGSLTRTSSTQRHTRWAIEDQDDDLRLYIGPARSADLLEIVAIVRDDGSELAIHAMKMRTKYQRLLPGG